MASAGRFDVGRAPHKARDENAREFLAIVLAGELYAVELERVREILAAPKIVPVPRATLPIIGVCSVRGLLVTVLDLRAKLQVARAPVARGSRVLLSSSASGELVGLLVDGVRDVVRLASEAIEPTSNVLGHELSQAIRGVARIRGEMLVLLDLAAVVD